MKNVSALKSNNTNSPKTPGGISKSLLTPCRRVGLSRNWRKTGPSPFISPISSANEEVQEAKTEIRKRKVRSHEENIELSPNVSSDVNRCDDIEKTPSRDVQIPRRKKSKILLETINEESQENANHNVDAVGKIPLKEETGDTEIAKNHIIPEQEVVSTPVRTKSKKSKKRSPNTKSSPKKDKISSKKESEECNASTPIVEQKTIEEATYQIKEKSPNDLRKECIVVIQKKIFKNIGNNNTINSNTNKEVIPTIKTIDSDSDEAPLINLHKQNSTKSKVIMEDDDDFVDNKTSKLKSKKVKDAKSPENKVKTKPAKIVIDKPVIEQKPSSQSCFDDDDDDDDFDNKKTILIKKAYDKVSKPLKAKSTGSITQRDIDNLRKRIEAKKKLLLAQSLTPDTEELRSLIKKWQKGCQDALMELLDLMRNKFPDNERMDYSEMLKTLKIPPSLVGYDSENDCFNSPDDASIVLGQFKDI